MELKILFFGLAAGVVVATAAAHSRHPLCTALGNGLFGAAALGAVNLLAEYTGISIALSYGTALLAVVLGAPGVVSMLLVRLLCTV
ncbi:MAG: pro-sigmaK processing inhibitor BofA family protein [Pygmaiobacter sp.]